MDTPEIVSTTFVSSSMKADHLYKLNSFTLPKFGKYKKPNKTLRNHFPFTLKLWMYHTALIWYEQEILGHKA
jgi:hypothetical protein